jgi:polysaccharide deacetylase family protein (PEP-CTERM system associated)
MYALAERARMMARIRARSLLYVVRQGTKDMHQCVFTIDVEDWFNLSGTGHEPPPSEWDGLESRVERNFIEMLDLLEQRKCSATCFFVGYFAQRFKHLVHEARQRGHEIASHSSFHRLVYEQTPEEFFKDAEDSRLLLEDLSGQPVRGFRAPAFSVTKQTPWFFDKLAQAGYSYDSSVFPGVHQTGGCDAPSLAPYSVQTPYGEVVEFPVSAIRVLGTPMCFFGGGYLRLFPYPLTRFMGRRVQQSERPVIFYVHPREIDPDQPRMPLSRRRRFTSYVNLSTTQSKIERIVRDFPINTFSHYLANHEISEKQVLSHESANAEPHRAFL